MSMTREEFDLALNNETEESLQRHLQQYAGLRSLAEVYQRPDLAAVIGVMHDAAKEALRLAQQLGKPVEKN